MKPFNYQLLASIAQKAGLTSEEIRSASPGELREHLTKKTGKSFKIDNNFPWIGRGNVLRDGLMDSKTINQCVDEILGAACPSSTIFFPLDSEDRGDTRAGRGAGKVEGDTPF